MVEWLNLVSEFKFKPILSCHLLLYQLKFYGNFEQNVMKRYQNGIVKETMQIAQLLILSWKILCYNQPKSQYFVSMKRTNSNV